MERWLVFGGSGAIGRFLLPRLAAAGIAVDAISREVHAERGTTRWHCGDLASFSFAQAGPAARYDVVASVGPLDAFAQLIARERPPTARIVALSSTSVHVKQRSPDADERRIAAALAQAEAAIAHGADDRRVPSDAPGADDRYAWTILRPTLIYGAGLDRNLSRIAALARRWPRLPVPADARGLRQPVHADDVAAAVIAAAHADRARNRAYDLPGGETLTYRALVERVLAAASPPRRTLTLPWPSTAVVAASLRAVGKPALAAIVARMADDLAFDAAEAMRDLGYAPRPFRPTSA